MEDEFDHFTKSMLLEKDVIKYSRLNIALSSSTTTFRIYDKDITLSDMDIVYDNPAIDCLVVEKQADLNACEERLKVKEESGSKNYNIIFVNENFINEFSSTMNYVVDTINILKKEDIINEPTKILVG